MNLIELRRRDGRRFLFDFDSGWEIQEAQKFGESAQWVNHTLGRNMDAIEPYDTIRERLADKLLK